MAVRTASTFVKRMYLFSSCAKLGLTPTAIRQFQKADREFVKGVKSLFIIRFIINQQVNSGVMLNIGLCCFHIIRRYFGFVAFQGLTLTNWQTRSLCSSPKIYLSSQKVC